MMKEDETHGEVHVSRYPGLVAGKWSIESGHVSGLG